MDITTHHYIVILTIILSFTNECFGRIGFVKDQSLDKVKWPPIIKKNRAGIPTGHLRPLGWQRAPDGAVASVSGMIAAQDFYQQYVNQSKPVVFKSAISQVPAMKTWQKDEYLKKTYGQLQVHAVVKRELLQKGTKKLTLKHFLREYNFEDWYLSNIIPQEMKHELVLPQILSCGFPTYLQESGIWMSSGGTVSLLHAHSDHNLHCVMAGRKDFVLIQEKYKDRTYFVPQRAHPGQGYSAITNMEKINMYNHPKLAEAPWTWASLLEGDCIYIPANYLHQVNSYGRSFSSTIMWAPSPTLDMSQCLAGPGGEDLTLDKAPLIWAYLHADRELADRKLNATSMKHHLKVWMRKGDGLLFDTFKDYFNEIMSEIPKSDKPDLISAWKLVSGGVKTAKIVMRDDVMNLADGTLLKLADILNSAHEYHGHDDKATKSKHDEL